MQKFTFLGVVAPWAGFPGEFAPAGHKLPNKHFSACVFLPAGEVDVEITQAE